MTYNELYKSVNGWAARNIAQDALLCNGKNAIASDYDIKKVQEAEKREQK